MTVTNLALDEYNFWIITYVLYFLSLIMQVAYLLNINIDTMNYSPAIGAETMNLYSSCLQLENDGLFFNIISEIGEPKIKYQAVYNPNPTNPSDVSFTG